jgi:hypothetical protein
VKSHPENIEQIVLKKGHFPIEIFSKYATKYDRYAFILKHNKNVKILND